MARRRSSDDERSREWDHYNWAKEHIFTGRGSDWPDSKFDPVQLSIGIDVELEHTDFRDFAKIIAKNHLAEHRFYYSFLEEMENKMKRSK